MQLRCTVQLSSHPEWAMVRFVSQGNGGQAHRQCWSVFTQAIEFDDDTLRDEPVWGVAGLSTVPLGSTGEGLLDCQVLEDIGDGKLLIRFPTADPSDAWRKAVVLREQVLLAVAGS